MSARSYGVAVSQSSKFVFPETRTNPVEWGQWDEVDDRYSLSIFNDYLKWSENNPNHVIAWDSDCRDYYEIISSKGNRITFIEDDEDFESLNHPLKEGLIEFHEEFFKFN